MNSSHTPPTSWNTAPSIDMSALGEHLHTCKTRHQNLVSLHCAAQSLKGFMATRLMTTIVAVILLMGLSLLAL